MYARVLGMKTKLFVWEFLVGCTWIGGIGKDQQEAFQSAVDSNRLLHPATMDQAMGDINKVIAGHEVSQSYYDFLDKLPAF
jgi:hypothetical protein